MITRSLFILISICFTLPVFPQKVEVDFLHYNIIESDSYHLFDKKLTLPKGQRFIEVGVKVKTGSKHDRSYNLKKLRLEGSGTSSKPQLILYNNGYNEAVNKRVVVKWNEPEERKLLFAFPEGIEPKKLRVDKTFTWELSGAGLGQLTYFDAHGNLLPSSYQAAYYRTITKTGARLWLIRDYYLSNDQLLMESTATALNKLVREGRVIIHHENGQIMELGDAVGNQKRGLYKTYYKSGGQKSEVLYEAESTKYLQFWTEDGTTLLTSGNGQIKEPGGAEEGVLITNYRNYELKSQYLKRPTKGDSVFIVTSQKASFPGGNDKFYQHILETMVYPPQARANKTQGTVYIRFIVDEFGYVVEAEPADQSFPLLSKEAASVFFTSPRWRPARFDGSPVKYMMILPVTFRL